jgi:hypothetical protein
VPLLLALTTWSVYIADRLLDARRGLQQGDLHHLQERHRFHWRHRRFFTPLAVGAAAVATGIVFTRMPVVSLERNSVLAAATFAYFAGVHAPRESDQSWLTRQFDRLKHVLPAELLVGLLFTAGCVLPAFSRAPRLPCAAFGGVATYFALLAWLNCFAIQCWESGRKLLTPCRVVPAAVLLGMSGLVLAGTLFRGEWRIASLAAAGAVSALLLALLDRFKERLSPLSLRCCADMVLLTPLALLLR